MIVRSLRLAALAMVAVVASTAASFAAIAYTNTNVNLRQGPGTSFAVVNAIPRGERVDIDHCRDSWCFVATHNGRGWISASYLERGVSRPRGDALIGPVPTPAPSVTFGFSFGQPHYAPRPRDDHRGYGHDRPRDNRRDHRPDWRDHRW